ncbi:glycosyltransferase family 2 protein [Brevibacterium paucivorans]
MSSNPKVSVIIATKNAEATLGDALKSLTLQTMSPRDFEVVLVNDGSTDRTAQVAKQFEKALNLNYVESPSSNGVSVARNIGLEETVGDFITYLDGDDWFSHTRLENLYDAVTSLSVDFVKADYVKVDGFRRNIERAPCAVRDVALDPRDYILPPNASTMVDYPACWTGMYSSWMKDEGLLTFIPELRTCEDRPWTWKQHLETRSFACINDAGLCYRKGQPTSLTSIYDERQLDFIPAFRWLFAYLAENHPAPELKVKAARNFLSILYHQLNNRGDQMSAKVRSILLAGATTNVSMLTDDELEGALKDFGKPRIRVIMPVLRNAKVKVR